MKSRLICFFVIALCFQVRLYAGGISVDAGLTPPQNRFILRTQYRYMSLNNSMMSMNTQMVPLVLAYGVTSGFTVMARGMYVRQSFNNTSEIKNGLNDLFLLTKFRLYRKNTANYVIGIAPYIATNIPIGSKEISDGTLNPEIGLNISFRPRFFSIDVSTHYIFSDLLGKLESKPGNIFSLNTAFSALIPLNAESNNVLSPVLEMTYTYMQDNDDNSLSDVVFLSPGISFIHSSFTLEALVQIPAYQSDNSNAMSQNSRFIFGIKYMF